MTSEKGNTATQPTIESGTIHARVLSAKNLPTMDFGKRQDPYVFIRLEGKKDVVARSDAICRGGQNPVWTEKVNRDMELHWEGELGNQEVNLIVEVWNETHAGHDDLIGTGTLNVAKIVNKKTKQSTEYTVRLRESPRGNENRGEVRLSVYFGPPIRKALRAAQKAKAILNLRDSFVGSVQATKSLVRKAMDTPLELICTHKKKAAVAGTGLAILVASISIMMIAFAIPIGLIIFFTTPFWIFPALITSFATAPLWVPLLFFVIIGIGIFLAFLLGLGMTSQPVRQKTALLTTKFKQSELGKRVVYEKAENE